MNFKPGFRLSRWDLLVIVLALLAAALLYPLAAQLALLVLFVVGHFFVFCNVTRLSRLPEVIWALSFVASVWGALSYGAFSLTVALIFSLLLSVVLVLLELRKPSYHGMGWQRFNPDLPQWFLRQQQQKQPR